MRLTNVRKLSILALVIAGCAAAQSSEVTIRTLPKRFIADEVKILTSPFRRSSYDAHTVKKYIIPFALISGALIATDHRTGNGLPNTRDQALWSGRASQLGAWYSLAGVSGATYLVGRYSGNERAQESGLLALEAVGHAQVAVFALKQLTNRERPLDHDRRGGFWEGGTAFPSGHAASAFAMATVFAYEYRDHPAVPIAAYSVASLISVSRLSARRHWASDIFVGGSLGFMMGRATFRRYHPNGLSGKLMPTIGTSRTGPALAWAF